MSYYLPSPYNAVNEEVRKVQRQLNTLRSSHNECRNRWDSLTEDGIYGMRTAEAVMRFQLLYHLTSPQQGALGDTTIKKIQEVYDQLPAWQATSGTFLKAAPSPQLQSYKFGTDFSPILDLAVSTITDIIIELSKFAANILNLREKSVGKVELFDMFRGRVSQWDPKIRNLKLKFDAMMANPKPENISPDTAKLANSAPSKSASVMDIINARKKQSLNAKQGMMAKAYANSYQKASKQMSDDFFAIFKKTNVTKKVKIKASTVKAIGSHTGVIGNLWALKDLLSDIFAAFFSWDLMWNDPQFRSEWVSAVTDHFGELIDGCIDTILAELLVGFVVGGAVATGVVAGIPVLVVIILVIIVAVIIGLIRSEFNFSPSRFIFEFAKTKLLPLVMDELPAPANTFRVI